MTESEWLACTDAGEMFRRLGMRSPGRKPMLLACACLRRVRHLLLFDEGTGALEVAERFADAVASREELDEAGSQAHDALVCIQSAIDYNPPMEAVLERIEESGHRAEAVLEAAEAVDAVVDHWDLRHVVKSVVAARSHEGQLGEGAALAGLVRDVFPFRPAGIDPSWLTTTVAILAGAAYEERMMPSGELEPARLAVLSDALEEAGCDDADILSHLRSPGPHVRGCWALDLIRGLN